MATVDRSIFRKRAIEKYMQRQEMHVVLRLVSPRMFVCLWALLLLAVCAGALVWSIQEPILVQGKGVVVQPKTNKGKTAQKIVVLLLLPPDQLANLKAGQPVSITIASANITFNSSIQNVEDGVMSPAAVTTQLNLPVQLTQTLSGPSIVAVAPVEPMSLAKTYLGSQCQAQVQIGTQSALSILPGFNNLPEYIDALHQIFDSITQTIHNFLNFN
ncbi:MAG: hypothetical protein JO011_13600 [Ktedonobacteraceae bacterium]|nr:hypothetical protein [Verrucomicrobiota bacterium]MBV9616010.1 hypothetical protein [Ktedonobacteraceae bacterium]MBV9711934.1 hypothetical protein [Ktedonobacteraceae bacterium]